MKRPIIILLASLLLVSCNSESDNNLLFSKICKEWILKYNVIGNKLFEADAGHSDDKITFFKDNTAIYNSAGIDLKGIWLFNSTDSTLIIKENDRVQLISRLLNISDSLIIIEIVNEIGETVQMHLIPKIDSKNAGKDSIAKFYVKKTLAINDVNITIEFPFEPRFIDTIYGDGLVVQGYDYAYPDNDYENHLYGIQIYSFKDNKALSKSDLVRTVQGLKNEYLENMNGKLLYDKNIIFQSLDAREFRCQVYDNLQNREMIVTSIFFILNSSIIHLYIYSPVIDFNSNIESKTINSLDYFVKSFNIF